MSAIDKRLERASAGVALAADTDRWFGDFARPRVILFKTDRESNLKKGQ
jgi:hypothetical protein